MIDTKALRSKVLDLAVQGKLTEQLECDGTAEELYNQIQNQKLKLIEDGIINPKPVPMILTDDVPFDIPKGWRFVRLGDVSYIVRGGSPRPIKSFLTTDEDGVNWIKIGDVEKGGKYILKTKEKIKLEGEKKSRRVYPGDFLLTNSMSFGRPYISKIEGCIHDGWLLIRNLNGFDVEFLYHLLSSAYLYRMFCDKASGSTVDNLNIDKVNSAIVPLPPLAEQKRIVERVEEIFKLLDTIDEAQAKYSSDSEILKSKLISMGIQGKLTEQLESDGTAEELYQRIQAEKQAIIDSGVLKGKKKIQIQNINNIPFDIPSNWKWVRLGSICEVFGRIGFRGYTKNDIVNEGEGALSLSPSNVTKSGDIVFEKCTYITWEKYEESPEIQVQQDDVLIVKTGSSYGKCCVADKLPCKATINPQLAVLKYVLCNRTYLKYVLISSLGQKQFERFVIGAATPTFSQENLANTLISLPPLAEQKRIVDKLDEVLKIME